MCVYVKAIAKEAAAALGLVTYPRTDGAAESQSSSPLFHADDGTLQQLIALGSELVSPVMPWAVRGSVCAVLLPACGCGHY